MAYPAVKLVKALERAVRHGHPWLYRRALGPMPGRIRQGQVVRIVRKDRDIAVAYAQPEHPIGARVLTTRRNAVIDEDWVRAAVQRALRLRIGNPRLAGTDAFRLIHGENDGLPGLVIDNYAGVPVVVFDGEAAHAFWKRYLDVVLQECEAAGADPQRRVVRPLRGSAQVKAAGHEVTIREADARFVVDVQRGQKTGFFLDQRDNRSYVAEHARGTRVLNLFAYTGGFSVHAALAGARHVVTLDQAKPAIATARRNFELNDLRVADHEFIAADAFDYLEQTQRRRTSFGIVVCDPPSFAPSARSVPKAVRAYTRLNAAALEVVARGGLLATASCSSHLTTAMLRDVVAQAALEVGRVVRIVCSRGPAVDHPVLPGFPEGDYLSFLLVHVE